MLNYFRKLSNIKKLAVYLGSSVVTGAVDAGVVPTRYEHYVQLVVFFLTSIGIYAARNTKPTVASAVEAAAAAATTVADGQVPDVHASADAGLAILQPAAGPPTAPFPAVALPVPAA